MLKDKSQKPTKKLSLKTLTQKELKQVNGGQPLGNYSCSGDDIEL